MKILGVIPARAGSKGVIRKNIRLLNGLPLIAYSIKSALDSKNINDLIVSTDSNEIAAIAKSYGCEVPFLRPKNLAKDNSSSFDVIFHALEKMELKNKYKYDAVILLQPTTPFRTSALIDQSISRFDPNKVDSVVTVCDVGPVHPYRMYSINENNLLMPCFNDVKDPMMPRQNLPKYFIRSGDIYITSRHCIKNKKSLIGDISMGIEVPSETAINIDSEKDFILAEEIAKEYFRKK